MAQILIVSNNLQLDELLSRALAGQGHQLHQVSTEEQALHFLQHNSVALAILSTVLPTLSGVQLARRICQRFATPLVMLSPVADDNLMLDCLRAGADQYLTLPVTDAELLVRIQVLLRRVGLEQQRTNYGGNSLLLKQISQLALTGSEAELLKYLVTRPELVVSKSELQKQVLKKDLCPFDRNLDMHISNIRRKMVMAGLSKLHIKTVRAKGYSFSELNPTPVVDLGQQLPPSTYALMSEISA